MLGTLHNDTYFERMASSIGDKARLIDWLVPGSTLDIGAGDGRLVEAIQNATGHRAYGLDASQEAVDRSRGLVRLGTIPGIRHAFSHDEFPSFANVVMSALLHEVFSYNQPRGLRMSWMALEEASWLLDHGGRLLIRDGVGPDDPHTFTRVEFLDPQQGASFHEAWHELSRELGPGRPSSRTAVSRLDGRLYGPAEDVIAFLFVYVWGEASIQREAQEHYTCAGPLAQRAQQLRAWTGLDLVHARAYQQPGYVEHWEQLCRLQHRASPDHPWVTRPWPMTNAIWILQNDEHPIQDADLDQQEEDDQDD